MCIRDSHLAERLEPGEEVPAGECPECECFAYIVADEKVTADS